MGRSLRVALLSYRSKPHSGGQGVYVRALSRELTALGHTVTVFSGQPYPELDDGVPLERLPSLDLYREPDPFRTPRPSEFRDWVDLTEWALMCTAGFPEPLTFSLRAARELLPRAADFDVVHDNQSLGLGLLRLVRAGVPTVATVHHPVAIDRRLELAAAPSLRRRLTLRRWYAFTGMQARVAPRLNGITTVSESSRRDIETHLGVPAAGVDVIPVGIDPDVFTPPPPGRPRDRQSIVVTTSADVPLKGLVHLLEAVAKLRTERPVRLTVVGTARPGGPAQAALDRLGLRDAVRFTGPLPEADLVALLQEAAVVAIPSLYEGFSLPAIEAMACGTPLVTTDAGALPEVVGSKAGLRVPAGDVGELTAALQLVLDSPSLGEQLGRAGRRRALASYTWRATAERTAEWYADVLDRKGRS
ncbi:glycosyltransferase family 4 protein [Geodermatophilus sabuli]|uniref:Glycosyltransferase involved in cell wall bisynthesis n=1 Tax=Geodermatophilus sabuli TaxID=1564158 RepID=A0A285EBG1_9ACTN|nr:glycosyltransferase family 4 protein [Geodermatophilus sabuli]MBB3085379.1 glycosyltransferase involved in cell wall biosynthesis [Geodermatophilus sabuli]SNX96193.1 Glycosyltransferase involved in cell wall bisynthesis [Geodermatophilus sabuli]